MQSFGCRPDGTFFVINGKNNLLRIELAVHEDEREVEVDFSKSILPLVKEKKEMHMEALDALCEERKLVG